MECLDLEQLERFESEGLHFDRRQQFEEHLAHCINCRRRLDEVREHLRIARQIVGQKSGDQPTEVAADTTPGRMSNPHPLPRRDSQLPADSFPGYQILREISRGGQGVVYQAIQQSTKRKVAIKVLRDRHFAEAGERARFEREIQILGQLKHANIVTIYDSGNVGGNSYYVMDYISGQPLDEYAREKRLSIDDMLRLFAKVCDAVHAAHLRGIIHRDLKPSNIRVDTDGDPRVLDFGLAKLAGASEATESPAMTLTGQFLGSLPWSSPEQAEGQPSKIDIRTDVYALGVILYQLLTGAFPYEVVGNMRDVLDRILHADPVRPSTVRRQINDEVETIALKCLSKERERRYQSAGELARDVGHYLAGRPIEAKRDSAWYVLKKTARRYRTIVGIAALVLAVVSGGAVVSTVLWRRASVAEARQRIERDRAVAEGKLARTAEADALIAKRNTDENAEALRRQNYVRAIALADRLTQHGNSARVDELLKSCPNDLRDWEWRRLWWATHHSRIIPLPLKIGEQFVALSPDGRYAAIAGAAAGTEGSRELRVIEIPTGKTIGQIDFGRGFGPYAVGILFQTVSFAPDGASVLVELGDRLAVWKPSTDMVCYISHPAGPNSVAMSPDGRYAATFGFRSTYGEIDLFDLGVEQHAGSFSTEFGLPLFSPDGKIGVMGRSKLVLFEPNTVFGQSITVFSGDRVLWKALEESLHDRGAALRKALPSKTPPDRTTPQSVAGFSSTGDLIASGDWDGNLLLWDAVSGETLWRQPAHVGSPLCISFSSDGGEIFSAGSEGDIRVWDTLSGALKAVLRGHADPLVGMFVRSDGAELLSLGSVTCRAWDLPPPPDVISHRTAASTIAISPDGRLLVRADRLGWSLVDAEQQLNCGLGGQGRVEFFGAALFTPDGKRLMTVYRGQKRKLNYELWDVARKELLIKQTIDESLESPLGFAVDFSGREAAFVNHMRSNEDGGPIVRVELSTGLARTSRITALGAPLPTSFLPDGRLLISSSYYELALCDLDRDEIIQRYRWGPDAVLCCYLITSDARRLITGNSRGEIREFELESGREVRSWYAHVGPVAALALSPNGRRLASAGFDRTLAIWQYPEAEELLRVDGVPEQIKKLVFSARSIITSSRDEVVRWDAPEPETTRPK